MKKTSLKLIFGTMVGMLLAAIMITTASAATLDAPNLASSKAVTKVRSRVTVGMTLDCVNMTPEARKYADEHRYCDGKSTTPGDPGTNGVGTEVGDCGTTVLEVLDGIQPDVARFNQSAYSTRGGIVEVRKELSWVNFWSGRTGSHNQNYLAFGDWFNTDYIDTGTGTVRGTMKGWALLFWGGYCFFAPTSAQEYIY